MHTETLTSWRNLNVWVTPSESKENGRNARRVAFHFLFLKGGLTLIGLCGDKGLDERVCGLRVQWQRVIQRFQLGGLVEEVLLKAISSGVEVLLDGVEGGLEHCALLWRQVALEVLGDILRGRKSELIISFTVISEWDNSVIQDNVKHRILRTDSTFKSINTCDHTLDLVKKIIASLVYFWTSKFLIQNTVDLFHNHTRSVYIKTKICER